MEFRLATIEDLATLVALRKTQLIDEGLVPTNIDQELQAFFTKKLTDGSLKQYLLEDRGEAVASGAIIYYDFPPSYYNHSGRRGYIANMYTAPAYRGQGIATKMLGRLMDDARQEGVSKIWLYASDMGKPVYEKFGFVLNTATMDYELEL